MKPKDKVAGVTGSVRGLGWEMVQAFMQEGAKIVICDLDQSGVDGEFKGMTELSGALSSVSAPPWPFYDCIFSRP